MEVVELDDLRTCIYGRGFTNHYQQDTFLRGFSVNDPTKLNIMALHGDVIQSGQRSDYNPLALEDIKDTGLDYLALGHRHTYSMTTKTGSAYWAYSGCPEGRGFDELGDKGILIAEIAKGYTNVRFKEICKRKYFELKVDISTCKNYENITDLIAEKVQSLEPSNNLFKIKLQGEISDEIAIYTSIIKEKLAELFHYLKVEDETSAQVIPDLLAENFTLKGIFVKKVTERIRLEQDEEERRKYEMALRYGLRLLQHGEAGIE